MDLNDNAHNALTVDGTPLAALAGVAIPAAAAEVAAAAPEPVAAAGPMALELRAHPDALGGYNLQVIAEGFAFGGGQGYGLLSIDGRAVTRLYTDWAQLPPLEPGQRTVSVALMDGQGRPYHWQGQPVAATITVDGARPAAAGGPKPDAAAGEHNTEAADGESGELELGFLVVEPR